ncbi:hypothetical protein AMATHDRAFT_8053 [Amanita thiersii Skay4041]|uniref:Uncharacterized protein n=1 Tax=Amanita thiersii Skay4041 TaxID=703135 RepID=A0A2A9N7U1_9AGAR|nr:hypothetical protein AMATHDRAFT_8053 [Amanita thiersii Skay4041]
MNPGIPAAPYVCDIGPSCSEIEFVEPIIQLPPLPPASSPPASSLAASSPASSAVDLPADFSLTSLLLQSLLRTLLFVLLQISVPVHPIDPQKVHVPG